MHGAQYPLSVGSLCATPLVLCCILTAIVLCVVPQQKMQSIKLSSHHKACLLEEARKPASSKGKLAERRSMPLSTLCTHLKNESKIIHGLRENALLKQSLIRLLTYPGAEGALINMTSTQLPETMVSLAGMANMSRHIPQTLKVI